MEAYCYYCGYDWRWKLYAGIGDVAGTIIGVIILGFIGNIINLVGITIFWQQIIREIIISLAVFSSTRKISFKGV